MSRWVLVDDTDSGIQWTGSWFLDQGSQNNLGNYGLPFEDTLHGTHSNGSFSYSFEGSKVLIGGTIQYPSGSNISSPSWVCTVDGVANMPSDTYSIRENRLALCETDASLTDGPHKITVQATVPDNQTFWLDYIQYLPSTGANFENATLASTLVTRPWDGAQDGFQDVSLTWLGFYDNRLPLSPTTATYSVDGQSPVTFDLDGTAAQSTGLQYNQQFFQTPQLAPGNHTVQVVYQGNSQTAPLSLFILEVQGGTNTNSTTSAPGTPSTSTSPSPSPSPSARPASSGSPKNMGAIIGGSLGGLAVLAAFLVTFLFWRHRRKYSKVGQFEYGTIDPAPMAQPTVGRGFTSMPFHHSNLSSSESAPRWGELSSTTNTGTRPYGSVPEPSSGNAASQSTSAPDVRASPSNNKALEAHGRYAVTNPTTPIRLDPPGHAFQASDTNSIDHSYPRVVRDEYSGFRFPRNVESEQVRVLPPDYTAV